MSGIRAYQFRDHFIENVAGYIEDAYIKPGKDLTRLAIVFGGRRPSLFLKRELARRLGKPFMPPRFFTVDEFVQTALRQEQDFVSLADLDACYEIYRLTRKLAPAVLVARETFAQFLPWAREILTFIDHLDRELVENEALENVELKAQIGFDVPDSINALLSAISLVRSSFHEFMLTSRVYSRGFMYRRAALTPCEWHEYDEILFCGFFYLSRTETAIIKRLLDVDKATLFVQGDAREWSVLEQVAVSLNRSITPPERRSDAQPELSLRAGFDIHSEVCLVREALRQAPDPHKTVVVLPESAHVMPLLSELGPELSGANISMGYPLRRSALYTLFDAISLAQETRKEKQYYTPRYLSALGHPLIKNLRLLDNPASTRVLIHKIEEILTGMEQTPLGGCLFIGLSSLEHSRELYDVALATIKNMGIQTSRDELKAAVARLHEILFKRWEDISTPGGFSRALEHTLRDLVETSSLESFPLNVTLCNKMFSLCDELAQARFKDEPFEPGELFKIGKDKIEREMVSFEGSPLKGMQILGLLETRSLNFETVIVMDVNEGFLPHLKVYEPLIPREIMIHLGINHIEKEEEIQRYWFRRLIAGARSVTLVYQDNPDTEKSRFLEELIWERQRTSKSLGVLPVERAQFAITSADEKKSAPKTAPIISFLKERVYSASSLNTYLTCPLQFYFHYCLGLKERDDLLDAPESSDIGTFVHNLLEEAYKPYVGHKPPTGELFVQACRKLFDERFGEVFERTMRPDSFLIKEVISLRIGQFFENEKKRAVKKILGLEQTLEKTITAGSHEIRVTARIDRIDLCADDSLLVLDYKTGSVGNLPQTDPDKITAAGFSREALKKTIKSFQLPLYLALVDTHPAYAGRPANAALYPLKEPPKDGSVLALFRSRQEMERKPESMKVYSRCIAAMLDELFDPSVPFSPDDSHERTCSYCPFFSLCR